MKTERAGVAARAHGGAVAHGQLRKLLLGKGRFPHTTGKWGCHRGGGFGTPPPISAPSQPGFSNRNALGLAEAKVVIYHIELGPQGERASPRHSSARNQKSCWS